MKTVLTPQGSWWPRVLIGYFAVFITGIICFVVFAARQRVDLVRADYYDHEILFQKQIDSAARGKVLRVAVNFEVRTQELQISFPAPQTATGKILLYRPSDARLDREIPLALDSSGTQRIPVRQLQSGLWKVRLSGKANGEDFYSDTSVVIGNL